MTVADAAVDAAVDAPADASETTTRVRHRPLSTLSAEEAAFQAEVRAFALTEVEPRAAAMDRRAEMEPELIEQLFEQGLMGIESPTADGGRGGGFFEVALAIEELSRVDPSVGVLVHVQNSLVHNALLRFGNPEQQERFLPALARRAVGAFAQTERDAGSDSFALASRARRDGGSYVLDGRKVFTTSASEASVFLVLADAAPRGRQDKAITCFLVESGLDGLRVGDRLDKLGLRSSSTCELILESVRVPERNVLGSIGLGGKLSVEIMNEGRIGIGAQMVGLAQGALDLAIAEATRRRQFGSKISTFQGVSFPLAQLATQVRAARLLVYDAARLRDAKAPQLELLRASSMAKLFASQVAEQVVSGAMDVFGGNSYDKIFPVEKLYRDAKIGQIYEGTTNMQLRTIAYTLLGAQ